MSEGFKHSVKVPRFYKIIGNIIKQIVEDGASFKSLVYEAKHPNVGGISALTSNTLQHSQELGDLLLKTKLLFKEPRLDAWLARVLITELIWGKGVLKSDAKPIQTILSYEKELRDAAQSIKESSFTTKKTNQVQKPRYIRINTLLCTVDDAIYGFQNEGYNLLPRSNDYKSYLKTLEQLNEWDFIQDYHIPELLAFPHKTVFFNHSEYQSGVIILQDKASCLPGFLLNPSPGSVVLDMCAAPGMKTTHLAAILQNSGKIYASELNQRRYQMLCQLIESANASVIEPMNCDALNLDETSCPNVEYILVDPSCSGSGMDRIDFGMSESKCLPERLRSLQSFQVLLLRHALLSFPKVKRVVYSTCSIYPQENEMVVDEVLHSIGNAYQLVPAKSLLDWINFSAVIYECKDNCLYAKPDVDFTNGFFVAVFERNFDVPLPEKRRAHKPMMKFNKTEGESDFAEPFDEGKHGNCVKKRKRDVEEVVDDVQIKEEEEKIDEEVPEKKKKKKEKLIEVNEEELKIVEEVVKHKKAKKEKKKRRESESSAGVEVNSNGNQEVSADLEVEKSKKKKKKKKEEKEKDLEVESVLEASCRGNEDISDCDPEKTKKKKKTKKEKALEDQNDFLETVKNENEEDSVSLGMKKVKKKKKDKEQDDATFVESKKSKKRIKAEVTINN